MKKIVFILFAIIPFANNMANGKIMMNIGYTKYGSKLVGYPEVNEILKHSPNSSNGVNINFGIKNTKFEYGVYYGIGDIRRFGEIVKNENYTVIPALGGTIHSFGVYSNFYLSSLIKNNDIFKKTLNFYTTVKMGGYYISEENKEYVPNGLGINCYAGVGASYYFWKKMGLFGELGYNYYPTVNRVSMSKVAFRVGVSVWI